MWSVESGEDQWPFTVTSFLGQLAAVLGMGPLSSPSFLDVRHQTAQDSARLCYFVVLPLFLFLLTFLSWVSIGPSYEALAGTGHEGKFQDHAQVRLDEGAWLRVSFAFSFSTMYRRLCWPSPFFLPGGLRGPTDTRTSHSRAGSVCTALQLVLLSKCQHWFPKQLGLRAGAS